MTENNEKSTEAQKNDHRSTPKASAFTEFIAANWAPAEDDGYTREPVADYAAERRAKISKAFPGERLVLPAGPLKVRPTTATTASVPTRRLRTRPVWASTTNPTLC